MMYRVPSEAARKFCLEYFVDERSKSFLVPLFGPGFPSENPETDVDSVETNVSTTAVLVGMGNETTDYWCTYPKIFQPLKWKVAEYPLSPVFSNFFSEGEATESGLPTI
jgi:hypothetical protein